MQTLLKWARKCSQVFMGLVIFSISFANPLVGQEVKWSEIAKWQGKGYKSTETFHIPSNEWRILWDTKPGKYGDMNFQIFVYEASGSLASVVANVIGKDKDSSYMRGSGDYYLIINTGQPYQVIIEAKGQVKKLESHSAAKWKKVVSWEGKGIKNTETIRISSQEWRISWSTKPSEYGEMNFQIFVYKADGTLVTMAANVIGEDKDSSYIRGSGDYYFTINTGQIYQVIVEAKL
ncbi:MAG TPA: hypothetical protein PK512_00430 [bacterium]|nr:hypothetical protein [bacterium]